MSPPTIDLWTLPRNPQADLGLLAECLSSEELQRAERLKVADRREQFIYNRALLRRILASYPDTPADVTLTTTADGKPQWPESGLHFNLSHSDDLAILAVSRDAPVGVDLERCDDRINYEAIAHTAFSARQLQQWRELPPAEQPAAVLRAWTRKEALLKALGVGLGRPLGEIEVTFSDIEPAQLVASCIPHLSPAGWFLYDWSPQPGWFAALAAPRQSTPWRLRHFPAPHFRDESSQQARPVDLAAAVVTR
jgi:4'-phosphopantetheinyl transferase